MSPRQRKYRTYLQSDDWKKKRAKKRSKKLRCAICAAKHNIDIHHLNYRNLTDVKQSDLRRYCRRCHSIVHELEKRGEITYRNNNHHSKFAIQKYAVKKYLGITFQNMFLDEEE
tara:strand:- start:187 stop:528 length:342 start_codon:yes stop_codon:yes gene_type:complete